MSSNESRLETLERGDEGRKKGKSAREMAWDVLEEPKRMRDMVNGGKHAEGSKAGKQTDGLKEEKGQDSEPAGNVDGEPQVPGPQGEKMAERHTEKEGTPRQNEVSVGDSER
jgi:hypothetical protein